MKFQKRPIKNLNPSEKSGKDFTNVEINGKVYEKDVEQCESCDNTLKDIKKPIKRKRIVNEKKY